MEKQPERIIEGEFIEQREGVSYGLELMTLIAGLEGKKMNPQDIYSAGAIGAGMRVFDAAYDHYDIRTARENADAVDKALDGEGVVGNSLLDRAIEITRENANPRARIILKELARAERLSLEQREEEISQQRVVEITRKKGELSSLLFALQVNPDMPERRQRCYRELGYLIQLIDDLVDEKLDRAEGVSTSVTLPGVAKTDVIEKIMSQAKTTIDMFERNYEMYQTTEIKDYIYKLLAKSGVKI